MNPHTTKENKVLPPRPPPQPNTTNNGGSTRRPTLKTPVYCTLCDIFICCTNVHPEDNDTLCKNCVYTPLESEPTYSVITRRRGLPRCKCIMC